MLLYSEEAKLLLGGITDAQMQTTIVESLVWTNNAFVNSEVDVSVFPVYIGEVRCQSPQWNIPQAMMIASPSANGSIDRSQTALHQSFSRGGTPAATQHGWKVLGGGAYPETESRSCGSSSQRSRVVSVVLTLVVQEYAIPLVCGGGQYLGTNPKYSRINQVRYYKSGDIPGSRFVMPV